MNKEAWLKPVCFPVRERGGAPITGLLLVLVLTILPVVAIMSPAARLKIAAKDRLQPGWQSDELSSAHPSPMARFFS